MPPLFLANSRPSQPDLASGPGTRARQAPGRSGIPVRGSLIMPHTSRVESDGPERAGESVAGMAAQSIRHRRLSRTRRIQPRTWRTVLRSERCFVIIGRPANRRGDGLPCAGLLHLDSARIPCSPVLTLSAEAADM